MNDAPTTIVFPSYDLTLEKCLVSCFEYRVQLILSAISNNNHSIIIVMLGTTLAMSSKDAQPQNISLIY